MRKILLLWCFCMTLVHVSGQSSIADVISKAKVGDTMYAVIKQNISGTVTMDTFQLRCEGDPEKMLTELQKIVLASQKIQDSNYKLKVGIIPATRKELSPTNKPFPWVTISSILLVICIILLVASKKGYIGGYESNTIKTKARRGTPGALSTYCSNAQKNLSAEAMRGFLYVRLPS